TRLLRPGQHDVYWKQTPQQGRSVSTIMLDPTQPLREPPNTYIIQDRTKEEVARLALQDTMLTTSIGSVLLEIADPSRLRSVLDVGCGSGGWVFEVARSFRGIERLVGVDISAAMIAYARAQAKRAGLDGRVQFQVMDALGTLHFPPASFDLVSQRLGSSWLRT